MTNNNIKFDFDDILIVPAVTSKITSRYKDIILPDVLPLFTAPMDTVVDLNNKDVFLKNRINVVLPRTVPYDTFLANEVLRGKTDDDGVFVSLGLDDMEKRYRNNFLSFHKNAHILIDVANAHMQKIVDVAQELKRLRPDIKIMVGNIANPETYWWYAKNNCVDFIKISIGSGNACLTSKNSGVGMPMASLIQETYQQKQEYSKYHPTTKVPAIVADGGMKNYSDIIKALALGADYVAIGSIFNKALESSADNYLYGIKINKNLARYFFDRGYPIKKYFRGMSTKGAQKAMGKTQIKTSEGVTRYRKVEYHLDGWVENFEHYLRNAMSYADAKTLEDFIGKADICQITKNAYDRFNK